MKLDEQYWEQRYIKGNTGWDIGKISEPLKAFIDQLTDKHISILIPGCGNAYEAKYLMEQGFTNVTLIDIAPHVIQRAEEELSDYLGKGLHIIQGDFFELKDSFSLVLEQTFFCALEPALRKQYVNKMAELLYPDGVLAGVLFNRDFVGGPPFGGNTKEYFSLFSEKFHIKTLEECYNSIPARKGNEVFIQARVKNV